MIFLAELHGLKLQDYFNDIKKLFSVVIVLQKTGVNILFGHSFFLIMLTIVCCCRSLTNLLLSILKLAMKPSIDILISFGNKVKTFRKEMGISQEELAFRSDLHRTYIGMIERAEKNITLKNIEKIANGLDISVLDLFK